jgi:hypothetical protein
MKTTKHALNVSALHSANDQAKVQATNRDREEISAIVALVLDGKIHLSCKRQGDLPK